MKMSTNLFDVLSCHLKKNYLKFFKIRQILLSIIEILSFQDKFMKYLNCVVVVFLIALFSCGSGSENVRSSGKTFKGPKSRIAVLDFKTVGVDKQKSRIISELIRTELINTQQFVVIERSQVDMIMKEHGFTHTGITDNRNAAKIGKLLTAKKICIGTVMKLGESMIITSRVVDVEKGVAEQSAKVTAEDDESLVDEMANLVEELTGATSVGRKRTTKVRVRAIKRTYKVGEDIIVKFSNFPGTRHDYISIAKEYSSARNHYTYNYTRSEKEGVLTFSGGVNAPGKYEIRAHTLYHKGDYTATATYKIRVKK
jgi:TolB-like protein